MKKELAIIDKEKGIIRCTTIDERWYTKSSNNLETGLPEYKFYPSSTWITHYYYTSPFLVKWIADKGMEEADVIKKEAGQKGSKIHKATEILDAGQELSITNKVMNYEKGVEEEFSVEEWEAIISYKNWFEKYNPKVLATEMTVFNEKYNYAGTLDKIIAIPNKLVPNVRQIWILDIKTSKSIYDGHIMQVSSYMHADIDYQKLGITDEEWANRKMCILQLGYKRNQEGFKFTEIDDCFEDFIQICYRTWKKNNPDSKPRQIDLPISIQLKVAVEEPKKEDIKIKKTK